MAKVLRHTYRWTQENDDGVPVAHVAQAGTPVSDLPKEAQEAVKDDRRLTIDEKRFDAGNLNVVPLSELEDAEEEEEELPRYTPVRTPQSQIGGNLDQEERVKQAAQLAEGDTEAPKAESSDSGKKGDKK